MNERMQIQLAATHGQVIECHHLIAEIYNREYEVVFSDDSYDLNAKIEPWPHRFLMGLVNQELVACVGIYLRNTYVERFGDVSDAEIGEGIRQAGEALSSPLAVSASSPKSWSAAINAAEAMGASWSAAHTRATSSRWKPNATRRLYSFAAPDARSGTVCSTALESQLTS